MAFNKKTVTNLVILILVGAALYMGYLLFANQDTEDGGDDSRLTREEAVLIFPEDDADQEAREAHFDLAQSMAQRSDTLDITGCNVDPLVLELTAGQPLNVVNNDSEPHIISIDRDYEIAANSQKELVFNFDFGVGLYGYGCDGGPSGAGIFIVVE